jgi:hypothetical protein
MYKDGEREKKRKEKKKDVYITQIITDIFLLYLIENSLLNHTYISIFELS